MAELTVESSAVGGRKWRVLSVFFFKKYESFFYFSFHPPVDWVFSLSFDPLSLSLLKEHLRT